MQASFSDLEYARKKKLTRRDRFLADLEAITPWDALLAVLTPAYPSGGGPGRPPIGLERMLRMYVVQQCFGLSDEGTEDALYDSQAIRGFVGIDLSRESAPDATTLLKFRRLLEQHRLTERIFAARDNTIYHLYQSRYGINVLRTDEHLRAVLADEGGMSWRTTEAMPVMTWVPTRQNWCTPVKPPRMAWSSMWTWPARVALLAKMVWLPTWQSWAMCT